MGKLKKILKTKLEKKNANEISNEIIREKAYQIFLQRKDLPGTAESDWETAKKELMQQ